MNVHDLSAIRQARERSRALQDQYLIQRERRQLVAIRRARLERLARDKRVWATGAAIACAISAAFGGLVPILLERIWRPVQTDTVIAQHKILPEKPDVHTPAVVQAVPRPAPAPVPAPAPAPAPAPSVVPLPTPLPPQLLAQIPPPRPTPPAAHQVPPTTAVPKVSLQKVAPSAAAPRTNSAPAPVSAAPAVGTPKPGPGGGFVSYSASPPVRAVGTTEPSVEVDTPATSTRASAVGFTVVGMPTDQIILIKVQGKESVVPVQVGAKLPNGETLRSVNPSTGMATADGRTLSLSRN